MREEALGKGGGKASKTNGRAESDSHPAMRSKAHKSKTKGQLTESSHLTPVPSPSASHMQLGHLRHSLPRSDSHSARRGFPSHREQQ